MTIPEDVLRVRSLEEIERMEVIEQCHFDNLLLEKPSCYRLWHSRMKVEDGAPYNNQVVVEKYSKEQGKWLCVKEYCAK